MGCLLLIVLVILVGILAGFLIELGVDESIAGTTSIAIFVMVIVGLLVWADKDEQKREEENRILKVIERDKKQKLLKKYGLPIDCKRFRHAGGYNKFPNGRWLYVWKENSCLSFLSDGEMIEKHKIPLSDINFYSIKGDIRQETETTGGKATLGETVMAEGLLGTAAAMKKNQVIQNIKTIDERKTIINVDMDNEDSFIFFEGAGLYDYLLENIPGKEQSFVAMNK